MRGKVGIREAGTVSVVIFSNQGDNMCKNVLKGKCEKWQLAFMINRTINVNDSKWYNLHDQGIARDKGWLHLHIVKFLLGRYCHPSGVAMTKALNLFKELVFFFFLRQGLAI